MTDSEPRKRFNFGATPSWNTEIPHSGSFTSSEGSRDRIPGTYATDDPVDDIPNAGNVEPESSRAPPQNPENTCRICLSGAEDGI
jgi:hypothetical protein